MNEHHDIIVGIDNGLSGGICIMTREHGQILATTRTPVKKGKKYREIDVIKIRSWLWKMAIGSHEKIFFAIETPTNSKTCTTAASMSGSFHALRAMVELMGSDYARIAPQTWQKNILGKLEPGHTKSAALLKAQELWPSLNWIPKGCRTFHDGIIDAALIATYARRNNL